MARSPAASTYSHTGFRHLWRYRSTSRILFGEGALHTFSFPSVTREERDAFVRAAFGEAAVAPVAERYARVSLKESLDRVITEGGFVCESRRAARALAAHGAPVYLYELTHTLESPRFHPLGATHQVDLWFVFGNEEAGIALAPSELPLSHTIMDAWGRFARTGDPNGPGLFWPRYTTGKRRTGPARQRTGGRLR